VRKAENVERLMGLRALRPIASVCVTAINVGAPKQRHICVCRAILVAKAPIPPFFGQSPYL
jgi:hypothetical protein